MAVITSANRPKSAHNLCVINAIVIMLCLCVVGRSLMNGLLV